MKIHHFTKLLTDITNADHVSNPTILSIVQAIFKIDNSGIVDTLANVVHKLNNNDLAF